MGLKCFLQTSYSLCLRLYWWVEGLAMYWVEIYYFLLSVRDLQRVLGLGSCSCRILSCFEMFLRIMLLLCCLHWIVLRRRVQCWAGSCHHCDCPVDCLSFDNYSQLNDIIKSYLCWFIRIVWVLRWIWYHSKQLLSLLALLTIAPELTIVGCYHPLYVHVSFCVIAGQGPLAFLRI